MGRMSKKGGNITMTVCIFMQGKIKLRMIGTQLTHDKKDPVAKIKL